MKAAFYYACYGNTWDRVVSMGTNGPFSHVELVFSNGQWFSSSPRDGGVRFKRIIPFINHWVFVDVSRFDEDEMYKRAQKYIGRKYDWVGVLPPPGIFMPGRSFCSDVVTLVLRGGGWKEKTWSKAINPNKLYQLLTQEL